MKKYPPIDPGLFVRAWQRGTEAAAAENLSFLDAARKELVDEGVAFKLTNTPTSRLLIAIQQEAEDEKDYASIAMRIFSLVRACGAGKLTDWVHPEKGIRTAMLRAAAECRMQGHELDLEDLVTRAKSSLTKEDRLSRFAHELGERIAEAWGEALENNELSGEAEDVEVVFIGALTLGRGFLATASRLEIDPLLILDQASKSLEEDDG